MNTSRSISKKTLVMALGLVSVAMAQPPKTEPGAEASRSCSTEQGVSVCRDVEPGKTAQADEEKEQAPESTTAVKPAAPKGRVLLLLNIPQDIFARLEQDPAKNREYHAKSSWDYRPAPPAPAGADQYKPLLINGKPPWKYTPKESFAYTPKRDWSYNRDVFGRIWRANIEHDTQVVSVPNKKRGTYLMAVGAPR